jgi:hypothetical protein
VTGTDARNRTRFEPHLSGAALDNVVAIVVPGGALQQTLVLAPPFTARAHSQPATLLFGEGPGGPLAFVACLGTASVVVLDAQTAGVVAEIETGEVPAGLALDSARQVLWVLSRVDKRLRAYDVAHGFAPWGPPRALPYDPEPTAVAAGRTHLYDARADWSASPVAGPVIAPSAPTVTPRASSQAFPWLLVLVPPCAACK